MKDLKVFIVNPHWLDFNTQNNIFTYILSKEYNVILTSNNPDVVITGDHTQHGFENSKKIYWCPEPFTDSDPYQLNINNYNLLQYEIPHKGCFRLPLYVYFAYDSMINGEFDDFSYFSKEKVYDKNITNRKFCNFVCGGRYEGDEQFRDIFYKKLSKYKHIDCPGSRYNNMTKLSGESTTPLIRSKYKREFLKEYKFSIGFENQSNRYNYTNDNSEGYQGYTTEKLIEPMISNSLLLYWGNKDIYKEFNTKSFLNFFDYNDLDQYIERIIEIDKNDDLYLEYIMQPFTHYNKYFDKDFLIDLMKKIIEE